MKGESQDNATKSSTPPPSKTATPSQRTPSLSETVTTTSSSSSSCSESTDDKIRISQIHVSAPDGGWGWFVVFSTFIGNVLTDGTVGTFGIFYPLVLEEFRSSPALTSLTGSLIPAIYMISAPLIGALIHRFDCRRVSVFGGALAGLGLAGASFCDSIGWFAVFYGVLGGLGIGMNSLSGHLMVNTYFSKKRGIANGIVSSGAGMGVFILAPLLQYLLDEYAWRGTMLIYSGCVLQYCICGMLMRPLSTTQTDDVSETCSSTQETASSESDQGFSQTEEPLIKHKDIVIVKRESHHVPKLFRSQDVGHKPSSLQKYFTSFFHLNDDRPKSLFRNSLPDLSKNRDESHLFSHSNLDDNDINSKYHHRFHKSTHQHSESSETHLSPLNRKDIFYSGSIYQLQEYQEAETMEDFISSMVNVSETTSSNTDDVSLTNVHHRVTFKSRLRSFTSRLVDVSVFKYNVYVPVLLGGIFLQMGQFIPLTFLPEYSYSVGLTTSDVTLLISLYGISNIIGRLSAGCLANFECVSTLWLCTFGNLVCGVACCIFPLCTSLTTLCIYVCAFGYFIGYFAPLQVLIMVEYLGIDKLTSAYGILQLFKGPAALFGPPLAGMVYQWTTDYSISIVVAGVLFVLSAVSQATLPLINRISKKSSTTNQDMDV